MNLIGNIITFILIKEVFLMERKNSLAFITSMENAENDFVTV